MPFSISSSFRTQLQKNEFPQSVCVEVEGNPIRLAQEMAGISFCQKKTFCGECIACRRILHGTESALLILKPQGSTGISIDQVRRDLYPFVYRRAGVQMRLAFLLEVQNIRQEAANALLKVLEEPPENAHLILVTRSAAALLPTIRSRCLLLRAVEKNIEQLLQDQFQLLPWQARALRFFYPVTAHEAKIPDQAWSWYNRYVKKGEDPSDQILAFTTKAGKEHAAQKRALQIALLCILLFIRDSLLGRSDYSPSSHRYPYEAPLRALQVIFSAIRLVERNLYPPLLLTRLFIVLKHGLLLEPEIREDEPESLSNLL